MCIRGSHSGDLSDSARRVRAILDQGGLRQATIFVSGDLDETRLQQLLADGAPIDGFGVGTRLDASTDAPILELVYKLQEYAGRPRRKRSQGQATWPGRQHVSRTLATDGAFAGDCLGLEADSRPGEPLLRPVMIDGRRLSPPEPLTAVRDRVRQQLAALPPALRANQTAPAYPVHILSLIHI